MTSYNLITPEDINNDIKKVLPKLDKLYLDLNSLSNLDPRVDHRFEINSDIDGYMQNMRPYVIKLKPDLKITRRDLVHIGYEGWGDWLDLAGKDLYTSKQWVKMVEYYCAGESWWHYVLRSLGLVR